MLLKPRRGNLNPNAGTHAQGRLPGMQRLNHRGSMGKRCAHRGTRQGSPRARQGCGEARGKSQCGYQCHV